MNKEAADATPDPRAAAVGGAVGFGGAGGAIIGTAGHVDHGKTALVLALTGQDTDRLPEEKARGISIELGFASFTLPSGRSASIVDVPGHERFIRNMLAGATGMDLVLLVVAADEGVMPQTLEHLDILRHLGLSRGVIALTKSDLVDADWLELVRGEVAAAVAGTFLQGAAIVPVSSVTHAGLGELVTAIEKELTRPSGRDVSRPARLPIDRVFTLPGFGTVVTGTLVAGSLRREDTVELLPAGRQARVRGLEVHGGQVERAGAGQRVAVNLAGVDHEQVKRGDTLAAPGTYKVTAYFGARLTMTPPRRGGATYELSDGAPVHFHTGTTEVVARALLTAGKTLGPGDSDLVGFRAEEPVVLARGDRFIIRSYSPVTTVGGGIILEPDLTARVKNRAQMGQYLRSSEAGRPIDHLRRALVSAGGKPATAAELAQAAGLAQAIGMELADPTVPSLLAGLTSEGTAVGLVGPSTGQAPEFWADPAGLSRLAGHLSDYLNDYYRKHPYGLGADREDVRSKVFGKLEPRRFAAILDHFARSGLIQGDRDRLALNRESDAERRRFEQASRVWTRVEEAVAGAGLAPPATSELAARVGLSGPDLEDVLAALAAQGRVVRLEGMPFHAAAVERARALVVGYFAAGNRELPVASFRDLIGATRKYALPLLEYLDRCGITLRQGETRVAGPAVRR